MSENNTHYPDVQDAVESFGLSLIDTITEFARHLGLEPGYFTPGSVGIALEVGGELYAQRLTRAIRFTEQNARRINKPLRIVAIDSKQTGWIPPPDWRFKLTQKSHLERLHVRPDRRLFIRYDIDYRTWRVFSADQNIAVMWTADAALLPEWEDSFPLRDILHWSTVNSSLQMLHTAAISYQNKGILLTGPGGSGKSTTTAAAVLNGLLTAGDDFVMLDCTKKRAHAMYDTIKLDHASLSHLPAYRDSVSNPDRPHDQKSRIHLSPTYAGSLARDFDIAAIMLPRISGAQKSAIHPALKSEALKALVPTTAFLLRGGEAQTITKAAAFIREVPAFHLNLGADPLQTVDLIKSFIQGLSA